MLEELGVLYEHQNVLPHSAEILAYNASGKVPILLDCDVAISGSSAILTYLADKHGTLSARAGTVARAH
jgi:glutathione S-transferase